MAALRDANVAEGVSAQVDHGGRWNDTIATKLQTWWCERRYMYGSSSVRSEGLRSFVQNRLI